MARTTRIFLSTHPLRGATHSIQDFYVGSQISIHAPPAGCDRITPSYSEVTRISIHAPPAGCDTTCTVLSPFQREISIHAPPAGCDFLNIPGVYRVVGFLSTHPLRGATDDARFDSSQIKHFYPRTPCGVRQTMLVLIAARSSISIHAPPAGCDRRCSF